MIDPRAALARGIVDPLFWDVVKRLPVRRRLAEFRRGQWDDRGVFEERRNQRLRSLLRHAVSRVPFYRDRAGAMSLDQIDRDPLKALASLPVLTRSDLHEHFDALSCEMGRGTARNSSGGSTGTPVRFLHDGEYMSAAIAGERLAFEWAGVGVGDRVVRLWGAQRDLAGGRLHPRRGLRDRLYNRVVLDAFRMGDAEMADHLRRINQFRPACIEAYADAAYELAVFARRAGADVRSPGSILTSAGTLLPHMRREIEEVFGAPVFDRYGTREVGAIASECDRHAGLHLVGECVVVEIVDGGGQPVPKGHEGEILVTNLWNYTMPFIRYRIGDVGVWGDEDCACGRPYPKLARVLGRTESRIVRPAGGVILPEFFIHLIGVEYNNGAIRKFQVEQEALDRIVVRIVPVDGMRDEALAARGEIARHIADRMGAPCSVEFVVVDEIEPTATGKHLYTLCRLEPSGRTSR
jgi:phenylacetate-CoA ligase